MPDNAAMTYLLALSDALAGESAQVRGDIVAGVREELEGLDAEQTAAKIAELGDPASVAASARKQQAPVRVERIVDVPVVGPPLPTAEPRWLSLVAAVLVMLGGIVVPLVGWVAGIVVMWTSKAWMRRQKLFVTILPAVVSLIVVAIAVVVEMWSGGVHGDGLDGSNNPLLPTIFAQVWVWYFVSLFIAFATGLWLLATAKKD